MNFTRRTTFKDKLDEEIYVFHLMLNLTELMNGHCSEKEFKFKDGRVRIDNTSDPEHFMVRFISSRDDYYDVCESGHTDYLDIMNFWLEERSAFVRDENSKHYGKFTITNGEESSDELLDSYLVDGINRMPEEVYFQESLVRDDYFFAYEDIDRLLEALKVESTITSSFYHQRVPNWTYVDYHNLYDAVLKELK